MLKLGRILEGIDWRLLEVIEGEYWRG